MSRAGDERLDWISDDDDDDDDDLIEILASSSRSNININTTNNRSLLHPRAAMNLQLPSPAAGTRLAAASSRRPPLLSSSQASSRAQSTRPQSLRPSRTPQPDAAVIDLTEEPDSPVQRRRSPLAPLAPQQHRNPRRTTSSQRTTPPRLARSDSTFMAPQPNLIDLTVDSPEDERRPNPDVLWRGQRHHHQHQRHHFRRAHLPPDQLIQLEFINHQQQQSLASDLARGLGRTLAGFLNGEIIRGNFNPPDFDISRIAPPTREDSPKPPMEPAPLTREGFTRDTCADPDQERVVVCPACNEELAYHPAGSTTQTPPSKKRKRTTGEHHFWALKKCGHVYCAECFENRRPTKSSPNGAGFPVPGGKTPLNAVSDIRCAVEGCETKVAVKTEWVGIFL